MRVFAGFLSGRVLSASGCAGKSAAWVGSVRRKCKKTSKFLLHLSVFRCIISQCFWGTDISARGEAGYRSGFRFQRPGVRIPPGGPKQKAPQTAQLCGLWGFFLFSFRASQKRKTGKKAKKSADDASQMQVKVAPRTAAFRAVRRPKFFTLFCNTGQKENPARIR